MLSFFSFMSLTEKAVVLLFVGSVAAVFSLAAILLLRFVLERKARKPTGRRRGFLWFRRAVWALAGVGLLCIAYGSLIEPRWLQVTRIRITSAKLPSGSTPVRLLHVTDFHGETKPLLEHRVAAFAAQEKPDLIVFTGDALNDPDGLPLFRRTMSRLAEVAPTYAVLGNWDVIQSRGADLFGGTGVRLLAGDAEEIRVRGAPLWIAGATWGSVAELARAVAAVPSGSFAVFLYHTPDGIERIAGNGIDLCLSGHTHGGQVALPFYGALITLSKFGKRFEAGLYQVGRTRLYVNRGLGMEGGHAPRVRFLARPEVAVFEICPQD